MKTIMTDLDKKFITYLNERFIEFFENQDKPKKLIDRWKFISNQYFEFFVNSDNTLCLNTASTGSGKTTISMMWCDALVQLLDKVDGYVILTTEYENGVENLKALLDYTLYKNEAVIFEGKSRLCQYKHKVINKRGDKIEDVMNNQISISSYCNRKVKGQECKQTCQYFENCRTIFKDKNEGGIKNVWTVSHQINRILPVFLDTLVDNCIIFIDENFFDAIKSHRSRITLNLLENHKRAIKKIIDEYKQYPTTNPKRMESLKYLQELIDVLAMGVIKKRVNYNKLFITLVKLVNFNHSSLAENISRKMFSYIKEEKLESFYLLFNLIDNFLNNFGFKIFSHYYNTPLLDVKDEIIEWLKSVVYVKRYKTKDHITYDAESMLFFDFFSVKMLYNHEKVWKIIINDATGEPEQIKRIFNIDNLDIYKENWDKYDNVNFVQLCMKYNNKLAEYPKTSLTHQRTFSNLIEHIKSIQERYKDEKILVVSREIKHFEFDFETNLKLSEHVDSLGENIYFDDYPLSATNQYNKFNICIILGRPRLNRPIIKRESTLLNVNEEYYDNLYSRSHIKQAFGRILRNVDEKWIFLITGYDALYGEELVKVTKIEGHKDFKKFIRGEDTEKKIIITFLEKYESISIGECEKLLEINYQATRRLLLKLVEEKRLECKKVSTSSRGRPTNRFFLLN